MPRALHVVDRSSAFFRTHPALNAGFFGVQYSFGLQQSNMSPIYNYLAPTTPTCRTCGWPGR